MCSQDEPLVVMQVLSPLARRRAQIQVLQGFCGATAQSDRAHGVLGQDYAQFKVRPVAKLVERRTPGGESPGSSRSGALYMKLLTGMVRDWWEQPQPAEVSRVGRTVSGFDGHDKLWAPNSPDDLEFHDRMVGTWACATSSA